MISEARDGGSTSKEERFLAYLNELQERAEIDRVKHVDNSLRLEVYFQSANNLWLQGEAYRTSGDYENLYVLMHRFSCLYINVIRKHNASSLKQYQSQLSQCRIRATAAIKEMEALVVGNLREHFEAVTTSEAVSAAGSATPSAPPPASPSPPGPPKAARPAVHWEDRPIPVEPLPDQLGQLRLADGAQATSLYPTVSAASQPSRQPGLRPVVLPRTLVNLFLQSAAPTLQRDIEWCGIIAGSLRDGSLCCSHVLIPWQTGTGDTCTALNETDLFEYQAANDLMTIGWIHTHPRMDAFLSSVDLHTHANYQCLLAEAIAVVCAPAKQPPCAVLRVTDQALPYVLRCRESGFHEHYSADGTKLHRLAEPCAHVREVDDATYGVRLVDLQQPRR